MGSGQFIDEAALLLPLKLAKNPGIGWQCAGTLQDLRSPHPDFADRLGVHCSEVGIRLFPKGSNQWPKAYGADLFPISHLPSCTLYPHGLPWPQDSVS